MATGILRIQAFAARQSSPIEGVTVNVSGDGFTATRLTDAEGNAADVTLTTPACALSLDENNTTQAPYAVCSLVASKPGYRTVRIQGVQVFPGQVTLAQPEMIPGTEEIRDPLNAPIIIPPHSLFTGNGGSGPTPALACVPRVLDRVIIPKNITVHLGRPAASAQNVTVSFRRYIANVASSEVYPTWPEQALRANIHCQISLALNRIYTEWYPSKGYTFNITNSTSYDQYYVHGRTVFDVMVRLTDDIFNTYLRKTGTVNPYYSEYCDGKSVTCPGLKQWGTVTLANQGRNALQILKYYYGNDIEIIRDAGLLHDIGKISIPERILQKTSKLTDEEYAIMKTHVENSTKMIRYLPDMDYVIPAVVGHHERYDGTGYPRGLAGQNIPYMARILTIADCFDAMTAKRPYKQALSVEYAVNELEKNSGTQFDPVLVKKFVELIHEGKISIA